MEKIFSYRDLEVWKRSRKLVKNTYTLTAHFPQSQRFSLAQQIEKSCVSIPSNIAEGQAKKSTRDYIRHLNIALGSLAELDTQILLAADLAFISLDEATQIENECIIIGRMLNKLIASLKSNLNRLDTVSLDPKAQTLEPIL